MSAEAVLHETFDVSADRELVAHAVAGREESFAELVRRYQRPIASYIYRVVGNYDAALDLTQEVFIKVYNSLARYRAEHKFSTWIYTIAHNAAIDHLRRMPRREPSLAGGVCQTEASFGEKPVISRTLSPEQESEKAERRAEVEAVVNALPPAYRELIELRHAHDLSYEEIAQITSLPLGTVKNRIFRAREMMRRLFIERGITSM
jgi:RNA polymerase sigma-70 factor (ECF subfamily)